MKQNNLYGNQIAIELPVKVGKENNAYIQSFNCGNEVMNEYLKYQAEDDAQAVTFILIDQTARAIIGYYSLSCSGFIVESMGHFTIYPAVEIKLFAIDEHYQHLPYSVEKEDGTFSDYIFRFVISKIYEFTEEICGADKVILYAVPKAKNFYEKNGFTVFPPFMLQSESRFLEGCIPMYLDL